jgi:glucose uptake protein GlcU
MACVMKLRTNNCKCNAAFRVQYAVNLLYSMVHTVYHVILLRGIQLTHVQRYLGSTVKMVFSYKIFTFHEANTFAALPNA